MPESRECPVCHETYPLTDKYWYRHGRWLLKSRCLKCYQERQREYAKRSYRKRVNANARKKGTCRHCGGEIEGKPWNEWHNDDDHPECREAHRIFKNQRTKIWREQNDTRTGVKIKIPKTKKCPLCGGPMPANYRFRCDRCARGIDDAGIYCVPVLAWEVTA